MTTPDILETVGFQQRKIGAGDKELGYAIEKSGLQRVAAVVVGVVSVLALVLVWTRYEVRFERRTFHHKMRHEEHQAATKLAKVEMELWSHYHDDIHESHEAIGLLKSLNVSFDELKDKLHSTIEADTKDLGLPPAKAAQLAEHMLHVLADHKRANLMHVKSLVDHLVQSGKRSEKLEKHLDKEFTEEMKEEHKEEEAEAQAEDGSAEDPQDYSPDEEKELKALLTAFWSSYESSKKHFAGATLREDSSVYKELLELNRKLTDPELETPLTNEEAEAQLKAMNLQSVGISLEARSLAMSQNAQGVIEELLRLPVIPHKELDELEKAWRGGTKNSLDTLNHLHELQEAEKVPSLWMEHGAEAEEFQDAGMEVPVEE